MVKSISQTNNTCPSFKASMSPELKRKMKLEESCGTKAQFDKYNRLFNQVYKDTCDISTQLNYDKRSKKMIIANLLFPEYKYEAKFKKHAYIELPEMMLNLCSNYLEAIEDRLFEKTICGELNKGSTPSDLKKTAKQLTNQKSRKNFLKSLNLAVRMQKNYPGQTITPALMQEVELSKLTAHNQLLENPFA